MKQLSPLVSRPAIFSLGVAALLTAFFELWRLVLLLALEPVETAVPLVVLAESFLVGLRFDFAIASYVALPVFVISTLPAIDVARNRHTRKAVHGLLLVIAAGAFFIHLADIEFFKFFNTRLNGMALQWSDSPQFVLSMVWQMYPVVGYLLLYLFVLVVFAAVLQWLVRRLLLVPGPSRTWVNLVWAPVILAVFLVGARGRLEEKAPLNWGAAYFSSYDVANQLALNPTFTFLRDAVYDAGSRADARRVMERVAFAGADSLVRSMLGLTAQPEGETPPRLCREVRFMPENHAPPNVILVIMESFGSSHIGCLDNLVPYDLSPHFDSLAADGTLFTNIYSGGSHTYTGIMSTLYGYPTVYGKSVMKLVTGQNRFIGLPTELRAHDYETMFFTTHDPHFDNMQGFLMANGFMRVFSLFDFDPDKKLSTLGVPDHVMFDRAYEELKARSGRRWFATLLTASNHGPWVVPDMPFGPLPDTIEQARRLNAFKYSDWALGRFVRRLAADPEFQNTIIVVTADNGLLYRPRTDLDPTQYRLPFLILPISQVGSGAGERLGHLGSQLDIAATVLARLRLNHRNCTFGRNLLAPEPGGLRFAQFSDWDRIGYVEDSLYFIARLEGPESLFRLIDSTGRVAADSNLVGVYDSLAADYRRKALAVFQVAYFNMSRPVP